VVVGSLIEKDITLDLAQRLRTLLVADRVQVVLTRTKDEYVSIPERWNRGRSAGARLFVSLHVNAYQDDPSVSGFTVFYPKSPSQLLAESIEAGLSRSLRPYDSVDDGAQIKADLWVRADIPTVTVEPAYLTNPREAALLSRGAFRDAVARGVHDGLLSFEPQIEVRRDAILREERDDAERQRAAATTAAAGGRSHLIEQVSLAAGAGALLLLLARWLLRRGPSRSRRAARRRRRGSTFLPRPAPRDLVSAGRRRRP